MFNLYKIVNHAKKFSPVYKDLYQSLNLNKNENISLYELPILTNERLNRIVHAENTGAIFYSDLESGVFYQSSATTGLPKATMFGHNEWKRTVNILSENHLVRKTIRKNDRIANLCPAPSASYLFVHGVIENMAVDCSELPLSGNYDPDYTLTALEKFKINSIAGVNSTILALAMHATEQRRINQDIDMILCGGELMYGSQISVIETAFPNATIVPFMFATTETGVIGMARPGFKQNEFEVIDESCIVEIIDFENDEPITATGRKGRLVITSKIRTAAPSIRMDTGDVAQWLDDNEINRRFSVHGRKYLRQFKLGSNSITESDIYSLCKEIGKQLPLLKLQLQITLETIELVGSFLQDGINTEQLKTTTLGIISEKNAMLYNEFRDLVNYKIVSFDYFLNQSKQKARLITQ